MRALLVLFLFFGFSAIADSNRTQCTAKVANRTYQVQLDEVTRELKVEVDTGTRHWATANFMHSVIRNADIWSVPAGFNGAGIEFVWDIKNQKYWVCLTASECYVCR